MTFYKVSVLIPTRNRIERLKVLFESYDRTTKGDPTASELIFRVDDDDKESQEFIYASGRRLLIGPRMDGYRSMPSFFNELAQYANGDVLLCGNDDMVFKTENWAPRILEEANKYPDGLFNIGVHTHNETHFPFSVVSRYVVERLGFLWDPRIFWGDIFLRDVMSWFGRCVMLPEVEIEHDWIGFRPDKTFMEEDKDIMRTDPNYWLGTHTTAVREAAEKLAGVPA